MKQVDTLFFSSGNINRLTAREHVHTFLFNHWMYPLKTEQISATYFSFWFLSCTFKSPSIALKIMLFKKKKISQKDIIASRK